jgi:hypothetical protein
LFTQGIYYLETHFYNRTMVDSNFFCIASKHYRYPIPAQIRVSEFKFNMSSLIISSERPYSRKLRYQCSCSFTLGGGRGSEVFTFSSQTGHVYHSPLHLFRPNFVHMYRLHYLFVPLISILPCIRMGTVVHSLILAPINYFWGFPKISDKYLLHVPKT